MRCRYEPDRRTIPIEKKLARYNVPPVGSINEDKEEGTCRILYSQLNNASTRAVREIKMDKIRNMNDRFQVDINLFVEVGVNWKVGACNNFADWYNQDLKRSNVLQHATNTTKPGHPGINLEAQLWLSEEP